MLDVAVIGAGVVGGLVARELAKYELEVCILEAGADVALGATKANSAIVHAGFDAQPGTLKARLNLRGSAMMSRLCSELGVKYKNNGSLVVGFSLEDRHTLEQLLLRGKENGVSGLSIIERDEILKRLVEMLYERNDLDLKRGTFRAKGDTIEVIPANERKSGIMIELFGDEIDRISEFDTLTGKILKDKKSISIFPASHFVTSDDKLKIAVENIKKEMEERNP